MKARRVIEFGALTFTVGVPETITSTVVLVLNGEVHTLPFEIAARLGQALGDAARAARYFPPPIGEGGGEE